MKPVTRETCVCWCPDEAYLTACGRQVGTRPQTAVALLVTCWQCQAMLIEWYLYRDTDGSVKHDGGDNLEELPF